jgi:hypothetical protein
VRNERSKTMEYGSRKASPDVLKQHYIYIYTSIYFLFKNKMRSIQDSAEYMADLN